jgi:ABC-type multidrug transport system ATPase subunit
VGGLALDKLKMSADDDVKREVTRVTTEEFDGLITVKNLAKTYYLHHKRKKTEKADGVKQAGLNAEIDETQIVTLKDGKSGIMAVENTSFGLHAGECMALLGVNGAGKSTCFKSLTNEV